MSMFRKPQIIRRFTEQKVVKGYTTNPYRDKELLMDVQTLEDTNVTTADGTVSVKRCKSFSDEIIRVEDIERQIKADRLFFHGKWFECKSSRLTENTPLRHYVSTWIELLDQDAPPMKEGCL